MRELTTAESFYIKNHPDTSIENIAKDLGIEIELVATEVSKISEGKKLLKKMTSPGRPGIVVMTEGVSSILDDTRKTTPNNRLNDCIAKIYKDNE